MWDPAVYRRYAGERSRPFADLVARIGAREPRTVMDLGCGDGELTATLADRWPAARVKGIDSSAEMIAKARIDAKQQDIATWRPDDETDVVVTNAALQWVPGHQELISTWMGALPDDAWFAMQVPGNFDAPSHRALRELAHSKEYDIRGIRDAPVDDAAGYAARLLPTATVDAWETTYLHLLPATGPDHPVLTWMEGTALRPVKAALDDTRWRAFRTSLGARLAEVYPARSGHVAFPFRRIFVVAHKGRVT
ncbi:methyltransferase domain-containing protein [Symbioplanes lichenis]|uniref:methyltransferase domain-containing protein n=1 Tax=Symbioplanes lichenis TaxID=1629072 RepID=UPI0027399E16|nr:methyltransferase domain-containing protein [Actinoplanes lichenis]